MHIGEIIKKYRAEHNLTMEDFGNLIGRSKAYISMLEKNKNSRSGKEIIPSIETLLSVASVLNITLDELLQQLDDHHPILLPTKNNNLPTDNFTNPEQIASVLSNIVTQLDQLPATGEDDQALRASLFTSMHLAKRLAKDDSPLKCKTTATEPDS